MTRTEALAIARGIAICTCPNRSEKMVADNYHYANCPTDLIEDMADVLLDAVREEREQCAKVASEMYPDSRWHAFYTIAGASIAAAIQKGGNDGTQTP